MTQIWSKDPLVLFRQEQLHFWPSKNQPLEEKINAITRLIILFTLIGTLITKSMRVFTTGFVSLLSLLVIYYTQSSKKEGMTPNMKLSEVMNDGDKLNSSILRNLKGSSLDTSKRNYWYPEKTSVRNPTKQVTTKRIDRADERPRVGKEQTPTKNNPMMNVLMTDYKEEPNRPRAEPAFAPHVREKIDKKAQEQVEDDLDEKLFRDLGDEIQFDRSMQQFYTTANTQIPNDQKAFADFCYGNMSSCKDGDVDKCFNNEKKLGQNYA